MVGVNNLQFIYNVSTILRENTDLSNAIKAGMLD